MRLIAILFGVTLANAQTLVVSPGAPSVIQGETLQFTANKPVTWSLTAGSAGSISASGLYTAPSSVVRRQKVGPCQMLPPDHIFNTRVDSLPVHASSSALMALGGGAFHIGFEPAFWTNITTNSSPTYEGNFIYTSLNNGTFRVLEWPDLKTETGVFMPVFGGPDNHEVYVNRDTCEFSDIYNRYPAGSNVTQECPLCTGQSGVKYSSGFALPVTGGTDAAGMAQQMVSPGLSAIQAGAITSAMRFTMSNSYIKSSYVWPATANAYPWCGGTCFEYGMSVRLKSGFNISGFSAKAQIILTALKQYGMILTDGGTSFGIQTNANMWVDHGTQAAMLEITGSALRSSDFEVVDTSPLKINDASGAVKIDNGYVTPAQYAEVIVTDSATPTPAQARVRINLKSITVGVPEPLMTIMAGHTVNLIAWVTNTDTTTVTWSMSPSVGTLNSSTGEYTAPSGVSTPTVTRITATSTVDSSATAVIDVTVWPDNDGGAIRLDLGRLGTDITDGGGHKWYRDEWAQVEGFGYRWGRYPTDGTVHDEARYFYGDGRLKFYLPNGNYKARIYVNILQGTPGAIIPPEDYVCHLDVNGQLVRHDYSLGRAVGNIRFQGGYVDAPMKVSDGSGYVALRWRGPPTVNSQLSLAALEITADDTTPFIEIDDAGALGADMTVSKTRQFYAVGWYMSNSVTWSIVDGPGSIDANGLYRAPGTPPLGTQTVTVRATSTEDNTIVAEVNFNYAFGTIVVSPLTSTLARGLAQQFSASIGGVSYSNVTWAVTGLGSINTTGHYVAPPTLAGNTPVTITATSIDDPSQSGSLIITIVRSINPIRVNCGGGAVTDSLGRTWSADYGYSTPSATYSATDPIQRTTPDMYPIYQSSRYRYRGETFSYQFPVPDGHYRVTLKWAEYRTFSQGMRMDIKIEGNTVLSNFDPETAAGGLQIAYDRTFIVPVTDGMLNILFIGRSDATYAGAAINGIEIVEETSPIAGKLRGKMLVRNVLLK